MILLTLLGFLFGAGMGYLGDSSQEWGLMLSPKDKMTLIFGGFAVMIISTLLGLTTLQAMDLEEQK